MKKKITVEIEADHEGDFDLALEEAYRLIREGYREGADQNETGRFYFTVEDVSPSESEETEVRQTP